MAELKYKPIDRNTCIDNDIFVDFNRSGLRALADQSNRNVTRWWNTDYNYPIDLSTGVIATMHDYLVSTDMVHFAIERNKNVAKNREKNHLFIPQSG